MLRDTPPPTQTTSAGKSESSSLRTDNIGPRKRGGTKRGEGEHAEPPQPRGSAAHRAGAGGRPRGRNAAPTASVAASGPEHSTSVPLRWTSLHSQACTPQPMHLSPSPPRAACTALVHRYHPTSDQVTDDCSLGKRRRLSAQLTPPRTTLVPGLLPTVGPRGRAV